MRSLRALTDLTVCSWHEFTVLPGDHHGNGRQQVRAHNVFDNVDSVGLQRHVRPIQRRMLLRLLRHAHAVLSQLLQVTTADRLNRRTFALPSL